MTSSHMIETSVAETPVHRPCGDAVDGLHWSHGDATERPEIASQWDNIIPYDRNQQVGRYRDTSILAPALYFLI